MGYTYTIDTTLEHLRHIEAHASTRKRVGETKKLMQCVIQDNLSKVEVLFLINLWLMN